MIKSADQYFWRNSQSIMDAVIIGSLYDAAECEAEVSLENKSDDDIILKLNQPIKGLIVTTMEVNSHEGIGGVSETSITVF